MMDDSYWKRLPPSLSPAAAAAVLRLGVPAVQRRLKLGQLPGHRIGGSWIIFTAHLREWLEASSNQVRDQRVPTDVLAPYPETLTYRHLMSLFGKSKVTIYIWLNDGTVPAHQIGESWLIYRSEIAALLDRTKNS